MSTSGGAVGTLYTAARVIVGNGRVLPEAGVLVRGERIAQVAPLAHLLPALPPDLPRVDIPTGSLLPGLIDTHVHLGLDGGRDALARASRQTDAEHLCTMASNARALLSAGVTTARDLGARAFLDVALRHNARDGALPDPRLVLATRPLTSAGGHCGWMGGECAGPSALRRAIRHHHHNGADVIKVMLTGGASTPGSNPWRLQFSDPELTAVVDEAHRLGHPVAAHAHGTRGIVMATRAGVDTIEHCTWFAEDYATDYRPDIADEIAERRIAVCGTFNPRLLAAEHWVQQRRAVVCDMRRRGVRFVAGTDAGVDVTPHRDYARGLLAMAHYGFTPAEVLAAATLDAAEVLGLAAVTGSLEATKSADLIAVLGNPLDDLAVLADPVLVLRAGQSWVPDERAVPREPEPEDSLPLAFTAPGANRSGSPP